MVWGILYWLGYFLREGMGLGFVTWAGIPLFWDAAPVVDLSWGDQGWFRVGFGHGER